MEIDWDEVGQAADDKPRSILAEVLGRAEEITNLVVIFHDKDGRQHEYSVAGDETLIAMLNLSLYTAVKRVSES